MIKQVIAMRKDLNMRKGKMVSQGSHASLKVFFDRIMNRDTMDKDGYIKIAVTPEMISWIRGAFTKITVSAQSEDEVYQIAEQARLAGIPFSVIIDNGATEFHGQKTTTCVSIGPAEASELDKITGNLQLL